MKITTKENRLKTLEEILKLASGLNAADVSKRGKPFRNGICEYLCFKEQHYEGC